MEESFLKFEKWVSLLKKDDRVGFFTHDDGDGLTSGVIAMKSIERILGMPMPYLFFQHERFPTEALKKFIEVNNLTCLIVTDMNLGKDVAVLREFTKNLRVLILDHHPGNVQDVKNLTHISTVNFKDSKVIGSRYPACKLAYDFFGKVVDTEDLDWVASCGIITDTPVAEWREFIESVCSKYSISFEDLKNSAFALNAAKAISFEKVEEFFWHLYDLNNPSQILPSQIGFVFSKIKAEIDKVFYSFSGAQEIYGGLHFFYARSDYQVFGSVATRIAIDKVIPIEDVLVVVGDVGGEFLSVSARNQKGNAPVNSLLQKAVEGLKMARAGGHDVAAGGVFRKEDFAKFKKNLLRA